MGINGILSLYVIFFISKNSTKSVPWKLFLGPFVFIENYAQTQLEK